MAYFILAPIFFLTLILAMAAAIILFFTSLRKYRLKFLSFYSVWLICYGVFILFFTGPENLTIYPPKESSPYRLPWKAGVSRFVAQGNRSFTSHRDFHLYAWDFVMPIGTEVLATRDGRIKEVEDSFEGIGFKSNFIIVEHENGECSVYAHVLKNGSLVKMGDLVKQGQPIAKSGMVGQTLFPHLHFYVTNKEGTSSIPISFREVPSGVPVAGHFYISENRRE